MSVTNYTELAEHIGHTIRCVGYGPAVGYALNAAVECVDCAMVLLDYDRTTVPTRAVAIEVAVSAAAAADLPEARSIAAAMLEGLPREWFSPYDGDPWWVADITYMGHEDYNLPEGNDGTVA